MLRGAACLLLALQVGGCAFVKEGASREPLYPAPVPASVDWSRELARELPALKHGRGTRWPLVLWQGVGFEPLERDSIEALLERGIVQHLRLSTPDVEAARALEAAGAPVVLMEGAGGAWPYDTINGGAEWRLHFPPDAPVRPEWLKLADPTRAAGWQRSADLTRERLQRYRTAGVDIDAVWLDYEGAMLHDDYQALRASTAAARVPRAILENEDRYRDYRRRQWLFQLSRYLAAPVRQVYPKASVTNWVVMASSASHPVLSWNDWPHPPSPPMFFTHTNPIAYGIDTYFRSDWPPGLEIDRRNVDRFYTHLLLRQVSADAFNRSHYQRGMGAVVWVARWVPDEAERRAPVMSRSAYREALRHIWLRGADAMQVFNPVREGYEHYALWEVEDVQKVYDEMLAYREFLDEGEILNYRVPDKRDAPLVWSGLRLNDRAVVRLTNLGARQKRVYICLTDDWCVDLPVPRHGRTYELRRSEGDS